jgi:RimJ/RimL family protein N-acetyltransferase
MDEREPIVLHTERLTISTATEEHLPALQEVFATNPAYTELVQGPGGYSLAELQRDWHVAGLSGRTMLAIRRSADGAVVGAAEFMDEHPNGGQPGWLGLLLIRGDAQGQGYGSEALAGLLAHLADDRRWPLVRVAIARHDERALRFWGRHGFAPYATDVRRLPGGETEFVCLERRLSGAS